VAERVGNQWTYVDNPRGGLEVWLAPDAAAGAVLTPGEPGAARG
jgi:hypothetical protein